MEMEKPMAQETEDSNPWERQDHPWMKVGAPKKIHDEGGHHDHGNHGSHHGPGSHGNHGSHGSHGGEPDGHRGHHDHNGAHHGHSYNSRSRYSHQGPGRGYSHRISTANDRDGRDPRYRGAHHRSNYHADKDTRSILSPIFQVDSIYPGHRYWVRFYRGHIYKTMEQGDNIHHWYLHSHNFFDMDVNREKSKLGRTYLSFTEPDYEIMQMDKAPKYAMDPNNPVNIRPILNFARWRQIKFKPNSFIARNVEQIREALNHIKYCLVENAPAEDRLYPQCSGPGAGSGPGSGSGSGSGPNPIDKSKVPPKSAPLHIPIRQDSPDHHKHYTDQEEEPIRIHRPLVIVYPPQAPPGLIHEQIETERAQKLDIMASSPLGCLQSPSYY